MRFNLIDRVLERAVNRVVAVKCVTASEEYLGDHFPGFPVLPGVMMLEALVQAGRLLVEEAGGAASGAPLVVTGVRNVRYSSMVRPGESLRVDVRLRGVDGDAWDLEGIGTVDDQTAVQGRFRLTLLGDGA